MTRLEARCPKCHKLLFVVTKMITNVDGIEIKCTRCKSIALFLETQGDALIANIKQEA